jgi:hypothetical protein
VQAADSVVKPAAVRRNQAQTVLGHGTHADHSSSAPQADTTKAQHSSSSSSSYGSSVVAAPAAHDSVTSGLQTVDSHRHKSLLRLSLLMGVTMVGPRSTYRTAEHCLLSVGLVQAC